MSTYSDNHTIANQYWIERDLPIQPCEGAMQVAAQAWCAPNTAHKTMDPVLALEFARILNREMDRLEARFRIKLNNLGF